MKGMKSDITKAATFDGYGSTLYVGIGTDTRDRRGHDGDLAVLATACIHMTTASAAQQGGIKMVSYAQLRPGEVELGGKGAHGAALQPVQGRKIIGIEEKLLTARL